jgi:cell division initiation protein
MISPLELMNKEFSLRLRGYDRSEVDDFLSLLIKDYESLYRYYRKSGGAADKAPEGERQVQPMAARPEEKPAAAAVALEPAPKAAGTLGSGFESGGKERDWDEAGRSIREILAMAQKAADDARETASKEAVSIVNQAGRDASRLISEAEEKVKAAERRLADLSAQEAGLRARMKGFLEVYRQLIDDFEATSGIDYNL